MHLKTDTTSAQSHYAQVPTISHSRNAFSVSERHLTTAQFDYLYPIYVKNMYPGDTLSITQAVMARLQTQIQVLYDDLYFDLHAWFVPLRLLQTNWARFQFNAQPTGPTQDNTALTTPNVDLTTLGAGGFTSKSLYDYFGYPTKINLTANVQWVNNYWARAYNFIWNNDYRDENLQNAVVVDLDEGPDLASDYVLLKRGLRHDRFSSCLTATQKGASITLPIAGSAEVWGSRSTSVTGIKANESPIIAYQNGNYGAMGNNAVVAMSYTNAAGSAVGTSAGAIGQVPLLTKLFPLLLMLPLFRLSTPTFPRLLLQLLINSGSLSPFNTFSRPTLAVVHATSNPSSTVGASLFPTSASNVPNISGVRPSPSTDTSSLKLPVPRDLSLRPVLLNSLRPNLQ